MDDSSQTHDVPKPSHRNSLIPQSYVSGPIVGDSEPPKPLFTKKRLATIGLLVLCASIITFAVALASSK